MFFFCTSCPSKFTRKDSLTRHFAQKHLGLKSSFACFLCGGIHKTLEELRLHQRRFHKPSRHFQQRESAFKKSAVSYRYIFDSTILQTPNDCLDNFLKMEIKKVLLHEALEKNSIKFSTIFIAEMIMLDSEGLCFSKASIPFRSPAFACTSTHNKSLDRLIRICITDHLEKVDEFINNGSSWVFEKPIAFDIEIAATRPLFIGSSQVLSEGQPIRCDLTTIPNHKNLVDIPSRRNDCFLNCVAWFLLNKSERANKGLLRRHCKKIISNFNTDKMSFPVRERDIERFVRKNSNFDLNINVLFFSQGKIYPHLTGIGGGSVNANLLMVPLSLGNGNRTDGNESEDKFFFHFLVINNLDRFLSKSYPKIGKKKSYENKYFCVNCLNSFSQKIARDAHLANCSKNKGIIEKVPKVGENKIFFSKFQNCFKQDLIGYLDFECELSQIEDRCANCNTLRCKCDLSYTRKEHVQKPICFSFIILNREGEILHEQTYAGNKAGEKFLDTLLELEDAWIKPHLNTYEPMKPLNDSEVLEFNTSEVCYMCSGSFTTTDYKVRDHDHQNGKFLGAAHNSCNLKRRKQRHLKIFLHNGSKYDFHFLVKALVRGGDAIKNLYVLPFNMEQFRMIKFNSFMFLDSIAFLQASLAV